MSSSISLRILDHTGTPVIPPDSHNLDALMLEIKRLKPFPFTPDLIVTVHLEKEGQLATLQGQVDALRAVLWDDPRIGLVNAKAFEARRSGAVPFTLDVRDWMTHSSTEDGDAGEVMGEAGDQAKLDDQTEDRKPDKTQYRNDHTMQEIAGKRTDLARRGRGR